MLYYWTACSAIWILADAQAVGAFATSTPSGSTDDLIWQMEPTPPPILQAKQHLLKRDGVVDSEQPTLCGWRSWNASQPLVCDESYYCNADSSGNFGCCPDSSANATVANPCGYVTTCYETTCGDRCQSDAWAAVCTASLYTHCVVLNLTISGSYYTNYDCDTTTAYSDGIPIVAPTFIENTTSTLSLAHLSPASEVTTTTAMPTDTSTTSAAPKGGVATVAIVVLFALFVLACS